MSKFGRKPIDITGVDVKLSKQTVSYKGKNAEGSYELPKQLKAEKEGDFLYIKPVKDLKDMSTKSAREVNRVWGLHRALLSNKILGAKEEFVIEIEINGLGYKVESTGSDLTFSLGFSHLIHFKLPKGVSVEIEKNRQKLKVKSADKFLVGQVSSDIRALKKPEPYKGKGIKLANEVIIRKESKGKSA